MGTPEIAVSMLERLWSDGYRIIGVVSQPDKKVGRKQVLQMPPVKQAALAHDIPVYQPIRIRDDYEELMQLDIDLIVTCAYGQFIPSKLLEHPTYGSVNVHASLLPKLRGGAPIHKAVIEGHAESGVSIMRMVKKMDASCTAITRSLLPQPQRARRPSPSWGGWSARWPQPSSRRTRRSRRGRWS